MRSPRAEVVADARACGAAESVRREEAQRVDVECDAHHRHRLRVVMRCQRSIFVMNRAIWLLQDQKAVLNDV